MPYQVMWEPRGVYTRYSGNVTGADMLGNIEDVCRNERFEQHRYHILDFSDATDLSATEREMLISCGVLIGAAFVNHQVLVAAVVTRDNVRAALERCHALGVSPLRFEDVPDRRRGAEVDRGIGFHFGTVQRRLTAAGTRTRRCS